MKNTNKKKRNLSSSDSGDESPHRTSDSWAKFVVVESPTSQPLKINPFLFQKAVQGIAGEISSAKKLRSGSYLIECKTKQQSANLVSAKKLGDVAVNISPHKSLNSSKGILHDRDRLLADMSDAELTSALASQNVANVRRFLIKRNSLSVSTNTFLLTFSVPTHPTSIKVGFCSIRVEDYVPNPLRCYKCQKFGHGSSSCRGHQTCFRCSGKDHEGGDCHLPPKCPNCSGDHVASAKTCPVYKTEYKIVTIKVKNNISFAEARKSVVQEEKSAAANKSYAAVASAKPNMVNSSCQTDVTWLHFNSAPRLLAQKPVSQPVSSSSQTAPPTSGDVSTEKKNKASQLSEISSKKPNKLSAKTSSTKIHSNRASKGSRDPVKLYNKYGALDTSDEENLFSDSDSQVSEVKDTMPVDMETASGTGQSRSRSRGKSRVISPVKGPRKT